MVTCISVLTNNVSFYNLTQNGFQRTGCINMRCPRFQLEKGAAIAPGGVIDHVSNPKGDKPNLNLKIIKVSF